MKAKPRNQHPLSRRALLAALSSTAIAATAAYTLSYVWAKPVGAASWENPGDIGIGNPEAPVVVIEYFSLTCPHCMQFHRDIFPKLRTDFVETGKVRLILRDFPLNEPALDAAKLAHCGGLERYFAFVEALFDNFEKWTNAENYRDVLSQIGELGGVSRAAFEACLNDKQLEARILSIQLDGEQRHAVSSTPTLVINGKTHAGGMSIQKFGDLFAKLVPEG